jgi:hypothetical protein
MAAVRPRAHRSTFAECGPGRQGHLGFWADYDQATPYAISRLTDIGLRAPSPPPKSQLPLLSSLQVNGTAG